MAEIKVEFFGIPRQRARIAEITVQLDQATPTLSDLLDHLAAQLPQFGRECVVENRLADGYIANMNGADFLTDSNALLPRNCSILIMSADAGG